MKWQVINVSTNEDTGIKTTTEAMQLPHGIVLHVVAERPAKGLAAVGSKGGLASSMTFIPNARINSHGMIEHRM